MTISGSLRHFFTKITDGFAFCQGAKTLKELHPEIYKRKRDKQGRDASDESSDEDTEEKKNHNSAFDPKVTFRLSASDRFQAGYLLL